MAHPSKAQAKMYQCEKVDYLRDNTTKGVLTTTVSQEAHMHCAFGKVHHNSRIESWLRCIFGALGIELCTKSSILLAGTGVWKLVWKIDYFDYTKSLISRINKVNVLFSNSDILLKKT